MNIKTIDVNAKEWFDKVNGNSYFAASVTINYGMEDSASFTLPFQYGYDEQYKYMAFRELQKLGYIPKQDNSTSYWRYYEDNGIIARHSKQENCRKRELMSL